MERESVNFGSIAAKVMTSQEAFNDINKAIFPELEDLPSVPRSVFKAEMMSTDIASDRPLRVLCLGISISSTLVRILQRLVLTSSRWWWCAWIGFSQDSQESHGNVLP